MYSEKERKMLLDQIVEYIASEVEFEGLLQIGSGVVGYTDIYSDIDLMAGCLCKEHIHSAKDKLIFFFNQLGAVYIDERSWTNTVWGLSIYFENGLSADISFMPTDELRIRSPKWSILFAKTPEFARHVSASAEALKRNTLNYGIDNSIHHRFVYALRRCEIALLRGEYVYADMALSEARQLLLYIETAYEGKKLHQFKAFNTLDADFLKRLECTYPAARDNEAISCAEKQLRSLYRKVISQCDFLTFDEVQLKLLGCFEKERTDCHASVSTGSQ